MSAWKRPDPIPLRRDFYQARCLHVADKKVVVTTFRGEAAATHELLHVFSAIDEALEEVLESEHPAGLILDLRELKYSWGDEMARTLSLPSTWYGGDFPVVVVTSDLNRAGLTSLVRDEMFSDPNEWLADSEDEAVSQLKTKLQR